VSETTTRVLQLLGLLQSRRVWSGEELADRLGVTTRSVRRDVDRLRELGDPVHASNGHGGGGAAMRAGCGVTAHMKMAVDENVSEVKLAAIRLGMPSIVRDDPPRRLSAWKSSDGRSSRSSMTSPLARERSRGHGEVCCTTS
jgi:biotin operon repressor